MSDSMMRFERNRIPRNDLIRGRRTGIIITLLPISRETGDEEKRRNRDRSKKDKQKEKEGDQEKEGRKRRSTRKKRDKDRRTFRFRHPVYRSAMAGPMAWRSRQIIITNHQLFARNGW